MVDRMIRTAKTPQEIADMQNYIRLSRIEKDKGKLATSEEKKLNRARMRLLRADVIKQVNRDELEAMARAQYKAMPFWKRWWMRLRYRWRKWRQK